MGITISMEISKSTTREEWEKVYEETVGLIRHFPLVEVREIPIHGIDMICLVKTAEREKHSGANDDKSIEGWNAYGDSDHMRTAENYFLPRDLTGSYEIEPEAGDALLGAIPAYMDYDYSDKRFMHTKRIWGGKTQGEPYHTYLLAVAALIEARLGTKALTYGDITRGQFVKAVDIANKYLDEPIDMPDRCCTDRLLDRVKKLPLPENEQVDVFKEFYLGTQDAEFGSYIRTHFSEDAVDKYWRDRFNDTEIGRTDFNDVLYDYLLYGFGLEELCEYVDPVCKGEAPLYEKFIKAVMDAKLHVKDKNCADPLRINQNEERPYGVATLFVQFLFGGAKNRKVDRYIPIEEIKSALSKALSSKCNVEEIIGSCLREESQQIKAENGENITDKDTETTAGSDPADAFKRFMDRERAAIEKEHKEYDIVECSNLIFYEKGDSIHPQIIKFMTDGIEFLNSLLEEDEYKGLVASTPEECCRWIAKHNEHILIRDHDWDKVFSDIEADINSFGRYYGIFEIEMNNRKIIDMCKAFIINDELYEYVRKEAVKEN